MSQTRKAMREITDKEMGAILARFKRNTAPPIRNYKNAPAAAAMGDVPEIDINYDPKSPSCIHFGVDASKKPQRQRDLSSEECYEIFGVKDAVRMNFIPQMITSLVMDQAISLANYCCRVRLKATRKHIRLMQAAVEEYVERLREAYGDDAFRSYLEYAKRFKGVVEESVQKMEMHAQTLCRNQFPGARFYPVYYRTLIITMLIRFCQNYDLEIDKLIAAKLNQPVHQQPDAYQQIILAMCYSLADDLGFKIEPDKTMGTWINIISNKAYWLTNDIFAEEGIDTN